MHAGASLASSTTQRREPYFGKRMAQKRTVFRYHYLDDVGGGDRGKIEESLALAASARRDCHSCSSRLHAVIALFTFASFIRFAR
jgi:hypothetical protein